MHNCLEEFMDYGTDEDVRVAAPLKEQQSTSPE